MTKQIVGFFQKGFINMFKVGFTSTPLKNPEADEFFSNITASDYGRDTSFESTLRALLRNRVPEGESVNLEIRTIYSTITSNAIFSYVRGQEGAITLILVPESSFEISHLEDGFSSTFKDWVRLPKVTEFYRKQFNVLCFVNPVNRTACLIVGATTLELSKYHYLQCSIPAILPWYFDGENKPTEEDMGLIKSLTDKKPDKYLEILERIASEYNFEEAKIKKLLGGFETRFERERCSAVENEIAEYIKQINVYNKLISSYLKQKSEKEIELLGLKAKIEDSSHNTSEIEEYFMSNKNLYLVSAGDREEIVFICKSNVEYYDEEMVENFLDNDNSYIYKNRGSNNGRVSTDDMGMLIREIFINRTLKLRFCAAYRLILSGNVTAYTHYDYGYKFETYMPNPHIDNYACLGNYQRTINECLVDHDYISAIEQCVASVKSLNFGDYTVMGDFMYSMYSSNERCIELPNGEIVNSKNAIAWLKENNNE